MKYIARVLCIVRACPCEGVSVSYPSNTERDDKTLMKIHTNKLQLGLPNFPYSFLFNFPPSVIGAMVSRSGRPGFDP
jgi:hypothetical protein